MNAKKSNVNSDNVNLNSDNANVNSDEFKTEKSELNVNSDNANLNSDNANVNSDEFKTENPAINQSLKVNAKNSEKPQQLSLRVTADDFDFWNEFKMKYESIPEAFSALRKLAEQQPEKVEVEKTIEVIKEIPIKLSPAQVIVTFGSETADKIRLCRPFIAQGNVLTYEKGNDASFISALVNLAVNKTLERNFPGIIRRLNNKANS
ncbi:MAG: hypothetical protein A3F72_15345 [Bacteroidetes bacterium RIFCSPLOWO2_12_FULL_35_15]|nr:MAG: hypothetical protein A3F72_15345 [Bacteroidetes bacterium RIFCSPLOWO2_12_FULL_35_15]